MNKTWKLIDMSKVNLAQNQIVYNKLAIDISTSKCGRKGLTSTLTCGLSGSWIITRCNKKFFLSRWYNINNVKTTKGIDYKTPFDSTADLCDVLSPEWRTAGVRKPIPSWNGQGFWGRVRWGVTVINLPKEFISSDTPGPWPSTISASQNKKNVQILSGPPETSINNNTLSWSIPKVL